MTQKCANKQCKQTLEDRNPVIILRLASMLGFEDYDFCSQKCFIEFVKYKFRKSFR